jgi:hypothetical protein
VQCSMAVRLHGPNGYRYQCVHDMIRDINRRGHISTHDTQDILVNKMCASFGYCAPCDNNPRGDVWEAGAVQ